MGETSESSKLLFIPDLNASNNTGKKIGPEVAIKKTSAAADTEVATLGAGCYWCVEAVLQQLNGVKTVTSGFMGGKGANPSYREVCSGQSGHAEVVQVIFDPKKISFSELLSWFWRLHDPTTLNR